MTRSSLRRFLAPLSRAFGIVVLMGGFVCAYPVAPASAAEKARRMTPEQRRDLWNQMSPEQREQWRNARNSGEQPRAGVNQSPDGRGHISPEERQAMRQRFYERQQGSQMPGAERSAPQRRQLSPEERQQLRQQIEAQRNIYRRADGGNRGANK